MRRGFAPAAPPRRAHSRDSAPVKSTQPSLAPFARARFASLARTRDAGVPRPATSQTTRATRLSGRRRSTRSERAVSPRASRREPRLGLCASQEPNRASERVGSLRAKPSDQYAEGLRPCRISPTRSLARLGSSEKHSAKSRSVRAGALCFARAHKGRRRSPTRDLLDDSCNSALPSAPRNTKRAGGQPASLATQDAIWLSVSPRSRIARASESGV